jgi:hypothetical protein
MEKNKTAVEWLIVELNSELNYIPITQWDRIRDLIQRAKEMEKRHIIDACQQGFYDGLDMAKTKKSKFKSAKQYYNEVYGKE